MFLQLQRPCKKAIYYKNENSKKKLPIPVRTLSRPSVLWMVFKMSVPRGSRCESLCGTSATSQHWCCCPARWQSGTPLLFLCQDADNRNKNKICRMEKLANRAKLLSLKSLVLLPLFKLWNKQEEQWIDCTPVVCCCTKALQEDFQKHKWRFDTQLLVASSGIEHFHCLSCL